MIDIFSGAYNEAINVRNLLENASVEVFTTNELMANIEPIISAGGFNPIILKVNEEDFAKAQKIVEDYTSGKFTL